MKILIVDDEEDFREIIAQWLEYKGCMVSKACDGQDALDKMRIEAFDAVLLDLMMPRMDGYEFCQIVKNDSELQRVPIIVLTATDKYSAKNMMTALGADAFLEKLVSHDDLLNTINDVTGEDDREASLSEQSALM